MLLFKKSCCLPKKSSHAPLQKAMFPLLKNLLIFFLKKSCSLPKKSGHAPLQNATFPPLKNLVILFLKKSCSLPKKFGHGPLQKAMFPPLNLRRPSLKSFQNHQPILFIAIGSRPTWGLIISLNSISSTRKNSFKFQTKPIHAYHLKSLIFSKNSIPILALWKSLFPFQSLTNFKILFPPVGRFSYKNIKLLN